MTSFDFSPDERSDAWKYLQERLESYYAATRSIALSPRLDVQEIRSYADRSYDSPMLPREALDHVIHGLTAYTVHTLHPGYLGLFNPRTNFPSILADTIVSTFNPQLAAWSHAPFAVEVERSLITSFGLKFGYRDSDIDGTFTTGGAEANLTALLLALNHAFPQYANDGLQSLSSRPIVYCSAESHHSLVKAVRAAGLGMHAIRSIPIDEHLKMSVAQLKAAIRDDLKAGHHPLMIVATAGTTGAGAIDPIVAISALAKKYAMWLHVDAAYGGAVALSGNHRHLIDGIALADSLTFDAHKWLSVSMSAGMLITRHKNILDAAFRVTADYMPKEASGLEISDPFTHSIQWSRRFIGLKLYLSLLIFGWKGYEDILDHHMETGKLLRRELQQSGWNIFNATELPIVCFGRESFRSDNGAALAMCQKIISSGKWWLSVYNVIGVNTLRACVTNYATGEADVRELVRMVNGL